MNRKIILGLILGCFNSFAVGSSNDIDQSFYNNILSNLDKPYRIITIKKESLNNIEKTVINYAIRNFKKDFVECNGKSYIRGRDKVYYVVDYKPTILFRTFPTINKADKLNGVVWRGDILIFLSGNKGEGVAQEVTATDHQSSKWQDMNRLRLSQFGNFEDVYRGTLVFYKNEIHTYYGDGIGNTESNDNKQLTCSDINQLLMSDQKHETNIITENDKFNEKLQRYKNEITQKVYRNWDVPEDSKGKKGKASFTLRDTGSVSSIDVQSDDMEIKDSIKQAIQNASPYPIPNNIPFEIINPIQIEFTSR